MAVDGSAVRAIREKDGQLPKDFAAACGISVTYLYDIERGDRLLKRRPDLIRKMAGVLQVPVSALVRSEELAS